eukprot:GHVT01016458.1.p1 GENE.GHVT01016458.1~~GHVT01016458.1.p1  ORF type:complete len:284 (-),score=27.04 GHVT01016458.1:1520-2371(-)
MSNSKEKSGVIQETYDKYKHETYLDSTHGSVSTRSIQTKDLSKGVQSVSKCVQGNEHNDVKILHAGAASVGAGVVPPTGMAIYSVIHECGISIESQGANKPGAALPPARYFGLDKKTDGNTYVGEEHTGQSEQRHNLPAVSVVENAAYCDSYSTDAESVVSPRQGSTIRTGKSENEPLVECSTARASVTIAQSAFDQRASENTSSTLFKEQGTCVDARTGIPACRGDGTRSTETETSRIADAARAQLLASWQTQENKNNCLAAVERVRQIAATAAVDIGEPHP